MSPLIGEEEIDIWKNKKKQNLNEEDQQTLIQDQERFPQKIEKEKELAEKLIVKTDNFSRIIIETPKIVPNGVELQKVDYIKNDSVVFYEGYALTDYDLNLFVNNIKKRVGNPDITSLSLAELAETIEINNEGDEEDQQIIAPSEDVLKLRNFKIKVEL